jgi:hypothetical protein
MARGNQMITIGADPEVFLKDKDGVHRSSIGKIGGSKELPQAMKGLPEGFYVQEDNVAAEFNIPPSTTAVAFSANIARGLKYLEKLAKKNGLIVDIIPAVHFDPQEFYDAKALELGCDPDFNAWTDAKNPRPVPPATLRTAAGHVHIGFPATGKQDVLDLIKLLDLRVSIPLVLKYPMTERRSLYGKAGAYRPTPYGCEYRTPDNYWLADKNSRMWMFKTVYNAVSDLLDDRRRYGTKSMLFEEINQFRSMICKAINEGDTKTAEQVMFIFDLQPMQDAEEIELKKVTQKKPTGSFFLDPNRIQPPNANEDVEVVHVDPRVIEQQVQLNAAQMQANAMHDAARAQQAAIARANQAHAVRNGLARAPQELQQMVRDFEEALARQPRNLRGARYVPPAWLAPDPAEHNENNRNLDNDF